MYYSRAALLYRVDVSVCLSWGLQELEMLAERGNLRVKVCKNSHELLLSGQWRSADIISFLRRRPPERLRS
ncbi:hypothetical protein CHARACLAT_016273 [Characodon lateralis]|uniref:Uncharacterized protein n=1 Tax=Characodon lateralis TaxID=208331 RepID=A0ABU7E2J7_9TELE|nr:hypothetical protein [Characodon lateralis]